MADENLRKIAKRVSKKKLEHLDNLSSRKDNVPIHSSITVPEVIEACQTYSIESLRDRLQKNSISYQPLPTADFPMKKFDHKVVNALCDEHNGNTSSYNSAVRGEYFQSNYTISNIKSNNTQSDYTISSIKSNNTQSIRGPTKKRIHSSFETLTSSSSWDESISSLSVTPSPESVSSFNIPSPRFDESVLVKNGELESELLGSCFLKHYDNQQQSLAVDTNNATNKAVTYSSHLQLLQDCLDELPLYSFQDILDLPPDVAFIDTHCNLDFLFKRAGHNGNFEDYRAMFKDTFPASYEGCVTAFHNPVMFSQTPLWKQIIEEEQIWGVFGCHPYDAKKYNISVHSALSRALEHHKVKALGPIGLDYSKRNSCSMEIQRQVFEMQLKLAVRNNKPLVIYNVEAFDDCLATMKTFVPHDYKIHLHGFMDSWYMAETWMKTFPNLYIGLTNAVTYLSVKKVHNVAWNIPLNRLLLESDAPNHLPEMMPRKLQWSHPGMAVHVAAQVAALKNVDLAETLKTIRSNTYHMYGI